MKNLTVLVYVFSALTLAAPARAGDPAKDAPPARAGEPAKGAPPPPAAKAVAPSKPEVTLKGRLGCGKCSFHEAKACQNVFKMTVGGKEESYVLADNEVSRANHEKVCGPAAPATVTGSISDDHGKKLLTATTIKFD